VATLILDELTQVTLPAVDESDAWGEEDIRDLTAFSTQHAGALYPEDIPNA